MKLFPLWCAASALGLCLSLAPNEAGCAEKLEKCKSNFAKEFPLYSGEHKDGWTLAELQVKRNGTTETIVRLCKMGLDGDYFAISFNATRCIPDWVAYRLDKKRMKAYEDEKGVYSSKGLGFSPDPELRDGRHCQASHMTYTHKNNLSSNIFRFGGTIYEKGHLVPNDHTLWSIDANMQSYRFSNAVPEHHNLNKGVWKTLETKTGEWAKKYGEIFIVAGVYGEQTTPKQLTHIGGDFEGKVTVPACLFKVIYRHDKLDPKKFAAIAALFKNKKGEGKLGSHFMSLEDLEKRSSLIFDDQSLSHKKGEVKWNDWYDWDPDINKPEKPYQCP